MKGRVEWVTEWVSEDIDRADWDLTMTAALRRIQVRHCASTVRRHRICAGLYRVRVKEDFTGLWSREYTIEKRVRP